MGIKTSLFVALAAPFALAGPDLVMQNVEITDIFRTDNIINIEFGYDLVNIGDAPIDLDGKDPTIDYDNVGVQTMLADTQSLDGQIIASGGSAIFDPVVLGPGELYEGRYTANTSLLPDPTHLGEFTWLVIDIMNTPETPPALQNNRVVLEINEPCGVADDAPPFGQLDLADVTRFVERFSEQDPRADLTDDGLIDLADVVAFVNAFTAGCL